MTGAEIELKPEYAKKFGRVTSPPLKIHVWRK